MGIRVKLSTLGILWESKSQRHRPQCAEKPSTPQRPWHPSPLAKILAHNRAYTEAKHFYGVTDMCSQLPGLALLNSKSRSYYVATFRYRGQMHPCPGLRERTHAGTGGNGPTRSVRNDTRRVSHHATTSIDVATKHAQNSFPPGQTIFLHCEMVKKVNNQRGHHTQGLHTRLKKTATIETSRRSYSTQLSPSSFTETPNDEAISTFSDESSAS